MHPAPRGKGRLETTVRRRVQYLATSIAFRRVAHHMGSLGASSLPEEASGARIAAHLRGVFPFMKSTGVPLRTRCASASASQLVRRMQP
jgi:hypothetical protein